MSLIAIDEIFRSIQTEGPLAGRPAVFIRTHGCPVKCPNCDTPQKEGIFRMDVNVVVEEVKRLATLPDMAVVITGGEPLVQPALPELVDRLLRSDVAQFYQMETSGYDPTDKIGAVMTAGSSGMIYVVSPKLPGYGIDYAIPEDLLTCHSSYFKLLCHPSIEGCTEMDILRFVCQLRNRRYNQVYLQPLWVTDDGLPVAAKYTADVCIRNGFLMSAQFHKWFGLK